MSASRYGRAREIAVALRRVVDSAEEPEDLAWFARIEQMRSRLNARTDRIELVDYGSGAHQGLSDDEAYAGIVTRSVVGEVAARRSKRSPWTTVLYELVRQTHPRRALELGTAYGVSAAFQAAAMTVSGGGDFTTIEGDPAQAAIAVENLAELGLPVHVVVGRFQDVLAGVLEGVAPLDYAFIDGHHERDATVGYFEQILPRLADGAVVVLDDISWSPGMREAWGTVSRHRRVQLVVDLKAIGVCVVGETDTVAPESYRLLVTPALGDPHQH